MAIALDSTAKSAFTGSGVSSNTCSLSTSGTDRIVLAKVMATATSGTPTISSVSGASLTWAKRSGQTFIGNGTHNVAMEVWWALASAQLTTQTITVTGGGTYDHIEIICEAYSGCNTTLPFDPNVSMPAYYKYENNTNQDTSANGNNPTVTTTNANTCIVGHFVTNALPDNRADTPNGWTLSNNGRNTAGTDWGTIVGEYFVKSATVSAFKVEYRDSANRYGIIGDALTSDATSATGTIDQNLPGAITTDISGAVTFDGAIDQNLPGAIVTAMAGFAGNYGTIDQNLPGAIQTVIFANQLETAGNPAYNSWWFLGP